MDRGKKKMDQRTDSNNSDGRNNIGSLKKPRVDYDAIIKEKDREIDFWRNAYMEEHKLYMNFSAWVKKEMENMVLKHQRQIFNLKNMAASNRLYFEQLGRDIVSQLENAFRQVSDTLFELELVAQDYARSESVPRYKRPEESPRPNLSRNEICTPPTTPIISPRRGEGTFRMPRVESSGPSRVLQTARMRTLASPPPTQIPSTDEEAMASVDRMIGRGTLDCVGGNGARGIDYGSGGVGGATNVANMESNEEEDSEEDPNYPDE